ncbi:hypothetical protein [Phycisphaera mikurensis]|uniref:Secreted protein n=1 Tax=Phycisphaera mikurensis (strain NBRC 102666 / KCTC 22515 / FYK2301M01) TaxID=1142394 RepID=I0IFT9_PHYMF|nr:hypothetical protein [Phycisphaera mikurensis]MBB6440484.1 hypothetical protein [Phycisphaera mikurensis]BAM04127.1 hypothetical protein PSMK_19680 [Phycisphaera mikurensis NBRC 102666]
MPRPRRRFLPLIALAPAIAASAASSAFSRADAEEVRAIELLPLEEASWPMKLTSGPGAGGSAELTLAPIDGGGWAMRLGDRNALRLHAADDGTLEVSEVELKESDQRLRFDPPALLVPGTMSSEETFQRSGRVEVFATGSGERQTSGTYEQTVPPPSRTTYELPSGKSEAFEVANEVKIDTDWASVDLQLSLGLSREHGPVYRRLVSNVTKAAFFGEKTTRTIEQKLGN